MTVWFTTRGLSYLGKVFIEYCLIFMAFLGIIMLVKGIAKPEKIRFFESFMERNITAIVLGILALYLFFMPRIGFLLSSYIFYACFNWYLAEDRMKTKHILISILLSFLVVTGFYALFWYFLQVPLPRGSWFE